MYKNNLPAGRLIRLFDPSSSVSNGWNLLAFIFAVHAHKMMINSRKIEFTSEYIAISFRIISATSQNCSDFFFFNNIIDAGRWLIFFFFFLFALKMFSNGKFDFFFSLLSTYKMPSKFRTYLSILVTWCRCSLNLNRLEVVSIL